MRFYKLRIFCSMGRYIGIVKSDDFIQINIFENLYKITKKGDIDKVRSKFYILGKIKKEFCLVQLCLKL